MGELLRRYAFPVAALTSLLLMLAGCGGNSGTPVADTTQALGIARSDVPDGVSAETWALLTVELARVLKESPPRRASAPPHGAQSATILSYHAGDSTLRWGLCNAGDYNQDGLVGISDLTPLGQHYGEESPLGAGHPFPPDSLGAVIDGNGDGLISISDVTAIGQNYGARVEGYRVYVSDRTYPYPDDPDEPNGPGATWLGTVELSEAMLGDRSRFTLQVVPTEEVQYYWVRPYHGMDDGVASNYVELLLPPNSPPEAKLIYSGAPRTPAHIVWDAAPSRDEDGVIVKYEWDFDGNGEYEHESGLETRVDFYYYAAGSYTCTVRVTDDEGATGTADHVVHVQEEATWHVNVADELLDDEHYAGILTPVALVNAQDRPGLFYLRRLAERDPETNSVYGVTYVVAEDAYGEGWHAPADLHGLVTDYGHKLTGTAAIVDGNPAVFYSYAMEVGNEFEYYLMFQRAIDAQGSNWPEPVVVNLHIQPDVEGTPLDGSLGLWIVQGKPTLLTRYTEYSGLEGLLFSRANDDHGSSWPAFQELNVDLPVFEPELAVIGGLPAVAAWVTGSDLLYRRALDATMLSWSEEGVLIDDHERPFGWAPLIEVEGNPAVFYYETGAEELRFRRARDPEGSIWDDPVVLDSRANSRSAPAVVDGRPVVFYGDRISGAMKFLAANDAEGKRWSFPVDTGFDSEVISFHGYGMSHPADVAGCPAFSYIDSFTVEGGTAKGERVCYVVYY